MTESNQANQSRADLPPPSEWLVNTLRLTAFPDPPTGGDHYSWWLDVAGEPPDTDISEPKLGRHRLESSFGGGKLTLQVQPGRIDWLFGVAEPSLEASETPNLGDLPRTLELFCEIASRYFEVEEYPTVTRLAFGATLLYPVDDREAGYQQLGPYLPSVQLDPASSSDFLYQINRRRDSVSGIPGMRINRLSKWSVLRSSRTAFFVGPSISSTMESGPVHFACRLELDINTVLDPQQRFDGEQSSQIFRELVDLGQEIVSQGDIP